MLKINHNGQNLTFLTLTAILRNCQKPVKKANLTILGNFCSIKIMIFFVYLEGLQQADWSILDLRYSLTYNNMYGKYSSTVGTSIKL